jgi:hypothetical protein
MNWGGYPRDFGADVYFQANFSSRNDLTAGENLTYFECANHTFFGRTLLYSF